jgi:hypothetical protein
VSAGVGTGDTLDSNLVHADVEEVLADLEDDGDRGRRVRLRQRRLGRRRRDRLGRRRGRRRRGRRRRRRRL